MRNLFLALALAVFIVGFSFNAGAQQQLTVVVPNSFTNVQGNFSNTFP